MAALPSKHSSGCHMATEEEDDQRTTPGRERSGKGDVDSRIQVEGWRKMEAAAQKRAGCGEELSMFHWERQGLSQVYTGWPR